MFKFDLQPNEDLVEVYRQAEVVLFKPVLMVLVLIYVPWFFLIRYELHVQYQTLLLLWTFIVLIYALNKYLIWLLNSYVLTSKRLVSLHYQTIFHKQVVETPLERILNISYETTGVLSSLLNFGNIEVQVVGLVEPMVLKNIKNPSKIKDILWRIHSERSGKQATITAQNFTDMDQNLGYQHSKAAKSVENKAKRNKMV
jgi:hypothetical protein